MKKAVLLYSTVALLIGSNAYAIEPGAEDRFDNRLDRRDNQVIDPEQSEDTVVNPIDLPRDVRADPVDHEQVARERKRESILAPAFAAPKK